MVDYYRIPRFRKVLMTDFTSQDDVIRMITELLRTLLTESGIKQPVTVEITCKFTLHP
jgi:hypothetical protein